MCVCTTLPGAMHVSAESLSHSSHGSIHGTTESCHNIAFMSGLPGSITVNTVMVMVRVKIMIRIIVQCYFIILQQYSPPYYHTADFAVKFNCGGIYHPQ